ncbi:unnamed protein product [Spirodela intermedia]|uniref:Uncharacterized protein n=1 Tax=Spirodela intermedia TaxID=51605 RepID=A0ABN7EAK4_SPIIN|nr:unnamed protein product [Spirodela intermedia]
MPHTKEISPFALIVRREKLSRGERKKLSKWRWWRGFRGHFFYPPLMPLFGVQGHGDGW